jgi:hypothetical protein
MVQIPKRHMKTKKSTNAMEDGTNENTATRCTELFEKKLAKTTVVEKVRKKLATTSFIKKVAQRYVFYKFDTY